MAAARYPGHTPRNVARDAKYSVVGSPAQVRLIYRLGNREEALLVTRSHPRLIEIIAEARGGAPHGVFYINEYSHVIVPMEGGYVYAGRYDTPLQFDYKNIVISPKQDSSLKPGALWVGPHVGIPYVLSVARRGSHDIYYWREWIDDGVRHRRRVYLSEFNPSGPTLSGGLARVKGSEGGRIYLNEARTFFAPVDEGSQTWTYRFLGVLGDHAWFPEPSI